MIKVDHVYDAIVVGAGPAGISCALECIESALDVIVIDRSDRVGGQLPLIPGPLQNFSAGFYATGDALRQEMEKVATLALPQRIFTKLNVQAFNLQELSLETSQGTLRARTIFLATGYRVKELDTSLTNGYEKDIYYHNGFGQSELENKKLIVVGSGDSAMLTALDMAEICPDLKVLVRGGTLKARPDVIARVEAHPRISVLLNTSLKALKGAENLESVIVSNQDGEGQLPYHELPCHELPCHKLIAKLGYMPNTELFVDQLKSDERGHIIIDENFATSIEGVFAGGDIVQPGYDRIAFASGSGMMAAKSIRKAIGHNV
ncbi:thioredoxin-disulfide reductase [soil metagenome]